LTSIVDKNGQTLLDNLKHFNEVQPQLIYDIKETLLWLDEWDIKKNPHFSEIKLERVMFLERIYT
jgi:hypothetical protein